MHGTGKLRPGDRVAGRYEVRGPLPYGAAGPVFRALDRVRGVEVALTVLRRATRVPPQKRLAYLLLDESNLRREAEVSRAVSHDGVVPALDVGTDTALGIAYFTAEPVDGVALARWVEERRQRDPVPVAEAGRLCGDLLAILAAAHRTAVHGALTSENVLVTGSGRLLVLELGIGRDPDLPEVDARDDVYSAFAILHELLTGRAPGDAAPTLRSRRRDMPAALGALIARALDPDPDRRPPSASAALHELHGALIGASEVAGHSRSRWPRRVAACVLLGGGLLAARSGALPASPPAPASPARPAAAAAPAAASVTTNPRKLTPAPVACTPSAVATPGTRTPRASAPRPSTPTAAAATPPPDRRPPDLVVASPLDGHETRDATVVVVGVARDDRAGLHLTICGTPVTIAADGRFEHAVRIAEGASTVTVVARDAAGGETRRAVRIARDRTPPRLVLDPLPAESFAHDIDVSGQVGDDAVALEVNGRPCPASAGRFRARLKLTEGANDIVVRARDRLGNEGAERACVLARRLPLDLPGIRRGDAPGEFVNERDGSVMVFVPAGTFLAGDPPRPTTTAAFYVDKYETTIEQYARFLAAPERDACFDRALSEGAAGAWIDIAARAGADIIFRDEASPEMRVSRCDQLLDVFRRGPYFWPRAGHLPPKATRRRPPGDERRFAVAGVSWFEAYAYARFAGKRLPTEAEWERAARGDDGRAFPWGDGTPDATRASFAGGSPLLPVDALPLGRSPFGCHGMAGGLAEWCADAHAGEDIEPGLHRAVRGGSIADGRPDALRAARRAHIEPVHRFYMGVRCVRSE